MTCYVCGRGFDPAQMSAYIETNFSQPPTRFAMLCPEHAKKTQQGGSPTVWRVDLTKKPRPRP